MIRYVGLLGLFAFSCSKQPSHWTIDQIDSGKTEFCFTKLCYSSSDPVNGIDIELSKKGDQIQVYLLIHSTPVAALKSDPQSVAVSIRTSQEKLSDTAYRFQGGQRFLLSTESSEKIIELLKSKQEITILLNGYRTVLKPEDFEQKYETFLHPLYLRNPFQFSL